MQAFCHLHEKTKFVKYDVSVRHEYRNLVFEWNGVLVKFWSRMEWNTENLEYYSSIWSVFLSITRVPEKVDIQKIFRNTEKNYIRVVFQYRKKLIFRKYSGILRNPKTFPLRMADITWYIHA